MSARLVTRVAYLTSRFPKLSETFVSNEIAEVRKLGLDVDIYALVHERELMVHPEAAGLAALTTYPQFFGVLRDQFRWLRRAPRRYLHAWSRAVLGNLRSPRFLLRAFVVMPVAASFALTIERRQTDHIHAHWATHAGLAAYLVHLLTGVPYTITAHAHDIHVDRTMLDEKLEAASAVVTISQFNRDRLSSWYGSKLAAKVQVIRCGVDTSLFEPPQRAEDERLKVVMVASLERRKGHSVLLQACRHLVEKGVPLSCVIVGDGEERRAIVDMIGELGLSHHVTLAGPQPRPAVIAALAEADVFVLPSITLRSGKMEGIPVALMEAMAMELPVVTTRMSGIPELVSEGEHGHLIEEGDAEGLADALLDLHRSPATRRRMGTAGRQRVIDEYGLMPNAKRLVDVFTASIHRATPSRRL